jgi:hypothetical protein
MFGCLKLRAIVAMALTMFALTACGGGDENEKEAGIACETVDDCAVGFDCVDGTCAARVTCSDSEPCERGTCVDGACTNPEICDTDEACFEGFSCDNGSCVVDNCAGVTCERGVCSPDTGQCENSAVCARETQDTDCIDGFYCYGQVCTDAGTICDDVDCELGVCDPAQQECVNPDVCDEDTDCLAGSFCENGTCSANVCDSDMVNCGRGVCDSASGECVNADPCAAGTDCVNGFYCIESACTPVANACEVCEGNKVCSYDGTNAVTCAENPAGCRNAVDCDGDRICRDAVCTAPVACEADAFEPNEDAASAVDFLTATNGGSFLEATLCTGDVDQFTYDTTAGELFTGTLVVALSFDREDIGNGELELELIDPTGSSVGTATTQNGSGQLTYDVGAVSRGTYRIAVRGVAGLSTAGVRYGLYTSLNDGSVVTACNSAAATIGMTSGDTTSGGSLELGTSCSNDATETPEDIYRVDVQRRQLLTAEIENTMAGVDLTVGLRSQCLVDQTELGCTDGGPDAPEALNVFVEPGTYYVVVQGAAPGVTGGYDLNIELNDVVCTPGETRCVDSSTAEQCRPNGTGFDQVPCDNGCLMETGFCDITEGDLCLSPIDASAGGVFMGTLADFGADYDPGNVSNCAPFGAEGDDVVFSVQANAGDTITADFDATFDAVLYIVRSCGDVAASCVAGVDDTISGSEIVTYTAPSTGTYLVIGDAYSIGATGSWTMTIDVAPQVCTPGMTQCNGAALETCNANGTAYDSRSCDAGCDAATGACNVPGNATCAAAVDVTAGGSFTGFIQDYTADYDSTDNACAFLASPAPDATYVVNANAGDVIDITLSSPFDGVVYATTDCADVANSCAGGSSAFTPEFRTVATATGPIFIVVDSDEIAPTGQFTLDVTVQTPTCTPGNPECASDGVTLEYCDQFGLGIEQYTCSTTCAAGNITCTDPTGGICFDSVPVSDGDTITGDFGGTASLNPGSGTVGGCTFDPADEPEGVDYFYDVTVPAGNAILVDYASGSSFALAYLMRDCADANTCLTATEAGTAGSLFYVNNSGQAEDLTLVIDRSLTGTSTLDFDFTVDIFVPDCQNPNTNILCTDANTLQTCDAFGRTQSVTCNFGCNIGAAVCNDPPNDTCGAPGIDASFGGSFTADIDDYVNDFDPTFSGCTGRAAAGQDAVYTVSGTAGDIVRATLNADFNGALYAVTDCTNVQSSCTQGSDVFGNTEELTAAIPASGQIFIVVDSVSATSGEFTIDITVDSPVCTPNSTFCQNGDLATCDAIGSEVSLRPCVAGCDTATSACNPVPNDTCAMTGIDATAGGTFVGAIDDFTNDYDPGATGCTGFVAEGGDAVYTVNLAQGEILSAELTADFDSSLYVVTDCSMVTSTCVVGDDSFGTESVEFAAATAGTYYVIVDGYAATASGIYELSVSVDQPVCMANTNSCDAATGDVILCNGTGSDFTTKFCQAGCDAATNDCFAPSNETCMAATNADAGGVFRGAIEDYTSDYNPTSTDCTGRAAAGGDAVFSIQANPGDVIAGFLDAEFDASVYLVTDCAAIGTSCVANDNGSDASFGFSVPTAGVYYLVVDSATGASGNFELEITTGQPICNPGETFCNADGVTLEYCNTFGTGFTSYTCDTSCTGLACDNPVGGICADSVPLTSGASVTQTFEGSNSFEFPAGTSGACTIASGDIGIGTDWFYSVDMLAGQTLTADFTSTSSFAVMYLMNSCSQVNTCLAASTVGSGDTLLYTAATTETVYIVMDRTLSGSTNAYEFTLDITVQ